MTENVIITIGRQYGSGGREIGIRLAKKLEIPLYDHNLVAMAPLTCRATCRRSKRKPRKPMRRLWKDFCPPI